MGVVKLLLVRRGVGRASRPERGYVGLLARRLREQVETLTRALPRGAVVADAPYFMHGHREHDAARAADLMARSAMATQFAADFFHPHDRGHHVWADAFWAGVAAAPVAQTSHRCSS